VSADPTPRVRLRHLYDGGETCANPDESYPDWQNRFLTAYVALGNKATLESAHSVLKAKHRYKIALGDIYVRLSSSHELYDVEFAERFTHHEAQRLSRIESKLYEQMEEGEIPSIAYKHLQVHKLTRDRYKPPVQEMKVDKRTHSIEERRATLRLEMISRSQTMFGKEVKDVSPAIAEADEDESEDEEDRQVEAAVV